ncbi:uncharacterized protein [Miscanthus floridulus]|uniref:uncharacterized protein n=1 Tax=Miscanthus floridulus TaxID=154761 RepID=UPI00345788A6
MDAETVAVRAKDKEMMEKRRREEATEKEHKEEEKRRCVAAYREEREKKLEPYTRNLPDNDGSARRGGEQEEAPGAVEGRGTGWRRTTYASGRTWRTERQQRLAQRHGTGMVRWPWLAGRPRRGGRLKRGAAAAGTGERGVNARAMVRGADIGPGRAGWLAQHGRDRGAEAEPSRGYRGGGAAGRRSAAKTGARGADAADGTGARGAVVGAAPTAGGVGRERRKEERKGKKGREKGKGPTCKDRLGARIYGVKLDAKIYGAKFGVKIHDAELAASHPRLYFDADVALRPRRQTLWRRDV